MRADVRRPGVPALAALAAAAALGGCYFVDRGGTGPGEGGVDGCGPSGCDAAVDAGCMEVELCNGVDDDCDGEVDEGHDSDGDGRTWCGSGFLSRIDCDDGDDSVYPAIPGDLAAPERCDGKDNNCDGRIDEEDVARLCPGSEVCVAARGCIVPDCTVPGYDCASDERCDITASPPECVPGGCVSTGCPADERCDPVTRTCVIPEPLGTPCTVDAQCVSGVCALREAAALTTGPERFCSRACCNDSDCDDGTLCWSSGTAARLCVSKETLGRSAGAGGPGAACVRGSACQSGVCLLTEPAGCLGNCASDDDCPEPLVCGLTTYTRDRRVITQLACRPPLGSGPYGTVAASCGAAECASGLCVGGGTFGVYCSAGCRSAADCPPIRSIFGDEEMYCGIATSGGDGFAICSIKRHMGTTTTGATCALPDDCRDRACLGGVCADICCSDAQCSAGAPCRPVLIGDRWQTRCVDSGAAGG